MTDAGVRVCRAARSWACSALTGVQEWGPVVGLALLPALPLLVGSGIVNTRAGGDSPFLLLRLHQLEWSLRAGVFPVRWMPQGAYGLGYPFFNFYASLPYYLAAALKLLGFGYLWSIKLTQALGFIFAGAAAYGLARELVGSCPARGAAQQGTPPGHAVHWRAPSLLVALLYSCAPFHMVNVYVRGDSLSEFYALVFFPLILWALLRLHRQPGIGAALWAALSLAGLLLTHNISALIFSPFALLYSVWLAALSRHSPRTLATSVAALLGGACLSAWFWLPALAEQANVYLRDMTTGYFHYAQHFRGLDLIQPRPIFDYAITATTQPFRMGLVQAALAAGGLGAVLFWWARRRSVEPQSAFLVLLLAASTFMITPWSRPLWDHLPLLPMVQFPWRFLSLQALPASLIAACLVPLRKNTAGRVALLLGLLALVASLVGLRTEPLLIGEEDVNTERLMLYECFTANVGTTIRTDYLPRWVDPRPYTSEVLWQGQGKPTPLFLQGEVRSARLESLGPVSEHWAVEVGSPQSLLAFQTYYYPGWEAQVDGQRVQVEPLSGLGYIGLRLSEGRHEVSLQLARTPVQRAAELLSAVALVGVVILWARSTRAKLSVFTALAAATLALALLAVGLKAAAGSARSAKTTEAAASDMTMDFDRIPYLHHNPDGVRFGDLALLERYQLSSDDLCAGEDLVVITEWSAVRRGDLVATVSVVSPARHLLGVPQAVAVSECAIAAGQVEHLLHIPAGTPRGIYLVRVEMRAPEGEIRPQTARGEELGTTYLRPVRVSGEVLARGTEPILQRFGDAVALSAVDTWQGEAGTLEVTLTWLVVARLPQNYKTALRLKDDQDWEVARLDTQPGYGFNPTHMWRPGELVADRYSLSLDDGIPPGPGYVLEVTLYEAATLQPIGTARIPRIEVLHPTVRHSYNILHQFGLGVALHEVQLAKAEWQPGEAPTLLLKWAATGAIDSDYECHLDLLDREQRVVLSQTIPLVSGYPTSEWPQDAVVAGRYMLPLGRSLLPGEYKLSVTLVDPSSGRDLSTFVLPEAVRIVEAPRNFAIPTMQQPVDAGFGGRVRLLGYDAVQTETTLYLILHWQAMAEMELDYKVFVHLFDPATESIVDQEDVLAGGEEHPTTRWVPSEVVSGTVTLALQGVPDGEYRVAVGLYHGEKRLEVGAPPGFDVSAQRLILPLAVHVP